MVSSKIFSLDLSEYNSFKIVKIFFIFKNHFIGTKWKCLGFYFAIFYNLLPNFRAFINSDDCIGNIASKSIKLYVSMIMLTCSSEKISILSRYTGILIYAHIYIYAYISFDGPWAAILTCHAPGLGVTT